MTFDARIYNPSNATGIVSLLPTLSDLRALHVDVHGGRGVAEILSVSQRTVRRMIDDKRLPEVRIGRAVRVRPEVLRAVIEENEGSSGQ